MSYIVPSFILSCLCVCLSLHPPSWHYNSQTPLRCPLAPQPVLSKGIWIFVFYAFFKTVSWWLILWSVETSSWTEDHWSLDSASNDVSEYSGSGPKMTRKHQGLNRISSSDLLPDSRMDMMDGLDWTGLLKCTNSWLKQRDVCLCHPELTVSLLTCQQPHLMNKLMITVPDLEDFTL